jgi:tripartite ATP-independent transporter DctP family solute receptor
MFERGAGELPALTDPMASDRPGDVLFCTLLSSRGRSTAFMDDGFEERKMNPFTVRSLRRLSLNALLLVVALQCGGVQAQIRERNLRVGIGLNAEHPQGMAVRHMADLVARESQGKIKITLFGDGKLGNDISMIAELQKGTLDMTVPDSSTLVGVNKGFGVINFPYVFAREEDADLLLDGSFGNKLLDTLPAQGIVGLGWWENGFRHTTNSVRPISSVKDLAGVRIRVIPNPLFKDSFAALGATPVELPFPQVFDALSRQQVDGQENPVITIFSSRFYEAQKYLTLTGHIYSVWTLLISKKTWDSFSSEEQSLFRKAAREATLYERKTIREASRKAIADLQKAGMAVNELSYADQVHFRQLLRPVVNKYRSEFGEQWAQDFYLGYVEVLSKQGHPRRKP